MDWSQFGVIAFRLLLAGVLGAVIGLDRSYHAKEAGLRTHFLVSLGSALFTVISQFGFEALQKGAAVSLGVDMSFDPSRIAAQIVTGVGFLGAGTIMSQKQFVRGLTTAAGIWATAAIGMAAGCGMYWFAAFATLLTFIGLEVLSFFFKGTHNYSITFLTKHKQQTALVIQEVDRIKGRLVGFSSQEIVDNQQIMYRISFVLKVRDKQDGLELCNRIQSMPDVSQITVG